MSSYFRPYLRLYLSLNSLFTLPVRWLSLALIWSAAVSSWGRKERCRGGVAYTQLCFHSHFSKFRSGLQACCVYSMNKVEVTRDKQFCSWEAWLPKVTPVWFTTFSLLTALSSSGVEDRLLYLGWCGQENPILCRWRCCRLDWRR